MTKDCNSFMSGKNIKFFTIGTKYIVSNDGNYYHEDPLVDFFNTMKMKNLYLHNEIKKMYIFFKNIFKYEVDEELSNITIIQYTESHGIKSHFDTLIGKYGNIISINVGSMFYYYMTPIITNNDTPLILKVEEGEIFDMGGDLRLKYAHCIPDGIPGFKGKISILFKFNFKFASDADIYKDFLQYQKLKFTIRELSDIKYHIFFRCNLEIYDSDNKTVENINYYYQANTYENLDKKIWVGKKIPEVLDFNKYYYYTEPNKSIFPPIIINEITPNKDPISFKIIYISIHTKLLELYDNVILYKTDFDSEIEKKINTE